MRLIPLDRASLIAQVDEWLANPDNHRWLDFGHGVQSPGAAALKIMASRENHLLRAFTADEDDAPIGIVGLSEVNRPFGTALIWIVLGDKRQAGRGYPFRAAERLLDLAFDELGLGAVGAWAVESNHASLRIIRRLGFRPIGRQRRCHRIDGVPCDRLWFDLLVEEHRERRRA